VIVFISLAKKNDAENMRFSAGDKCMKVRGQIIQEYLHQNRPVFCMGQKRYENGIVGNAIYAGGHLCNQRKGTNIENAYKSF
jgi:hypothetical protein